MSEPRTKLWGNSTSADSSGSAAAFKHKDYNSLIGLTNRIHFRTGIKNMRYVGTASTCRPGVQASLFRKDVTPPYWFSIKGDQGTGLMPSVTIRRATLVGIWLRLLTIFAAISRRFDCDFVAIRAERLRPGHKGYLEGSQGNFDVFLLKPLALCSNRNKIAIKSPRNIAVKLQQKFSVVFFFFNLLAIKKNLG